MGRAGPPQGHACQRKLAETQAEMYRRTEHLLVLLYDRATWPLG
jgi:hypothetical protein